MKNLVRHIVSYSMILILLVSALQLSLYKMECIISGNTSISLSKFDDCNEKPINDCSLTEKCCCFHEMNLDFEYETNLKVKNFQTNSAPVQSLANRNHLMTAIVKSIDANNYTNLPPPSGIELLKVVQVFRL